MSIPPWIILSVSWELNNVQAVLTFVINILCALGIWAVGYVGWKAGALEVVKSSRVDMLSLLSLSGWGDAVDALLILRPNMGFSRILWILFKVAAIILLSVAAILSGPIANYSTQLGSVVRESTATGWLATTNHSGMGGALVRWNETIDRLKLANFPQNQLLDFLPDNYIAWHYKETEWNSSWLCSCSMTPLTPINLTATGNYTGSFFAEVPALRSVFPKEVFSPDYVGKVDWRGTYENSKILRDVLAFILLQSNPIQAHDNITGLQSNYKPLHLVFAAVHMQGVPSTTDEDVNFGIGPVRSSNYTMANCNISREPTRTPETLSEQAEAHIAFPWTTKVASIVTAAADFYEAALAEQSFNNEPIAHPSGEDIFRFYQAYMISKDTQYKQSVQRTISVSMRSVELATVTLAVLLLYLVSIASALLWFGVVRSLPHGVWIPQTKVEWMMQTLREAGGREVDLGLFDRSWGKLQDELRRAVYGVVVSPWGTQHMSVQLELKDDTLPLVEGGTMSKSVEHQQSAYTQAWEQQNLSGAGSYKNHPIQISADFIK